MDYFNKLTKEQMEYLIQDTAGEFGNLQALTTSLNASKGSRLAYEWESVGYKGESLNSDYVGWLKRRQSVILENMQNRVNDFLQLNNTGQ